MFLVEWYQGLQEIAADESMGRDYWRDMMAVRAAVNKEMEAQRAAGNLRGSLDAQIILYAEPALLDQLGKLEDELRFVLISSAATLAPLVAATDDAAATELPGLRLQVRASSDEKCERCWHRRPDVGQAVEHATLCGRCIDNVYGDGEQRRYA